jgi:tetratricopeptide (TPR) repeat protein
MSRSHREDTEALYRRGVAMWAERRLTEAGELFRAALAASPGLEDGWWFSTSRAMAQVAMELGDLDTARRHLARLPGQGVGVAQQMALRARLARIEGDEDAAPLQIGAALRSLAGDGEMDPGSLMNGAIALMWCGDVLRDLGFGRDASRVAELARQRVFLAGIHDPTLEAGLAVVEAGGARLAGDVTAAVRILDSIDLSLSPEFLMEITLERARLAWLADDKQEAQRFYEEAGAGAASLQYESMARSIREESAAGPRLLRADSHSELVARKSEELAGATKPYAVVVRYVVDRPLDSYFDVERTVEEFLSARPQLGYVDGNGTDGRVWDLYLEGEDPGNLWQEIRTLVTTIASPGSHVEIRRAAGVETITLG